MIFGFPSKIITNFINTISFTFTDSEIQSAIFTVTNNMLVQNTEVLRQNLNGYYIEQPIIQNTNTYAYNAATLSGSQYFSHSNFPQLGLHDISIICSFSSTASGSQMLVTRQDDGLNNAWSVYLFNGTLVLDTTIGVGNYCIKQTSATFNDGQMHHIIVTMQRSGNYILYVDGVLITLNPLSVAGSITSNHNSSHELRIGRRVGSGYPFNGKISRVGIAYGQDLTQYKQYLSSLSNYGDLPPNVQKLFTAYYDLANWQNHNNFELLDRTGNSGALTAIGNPTYTPTGLNIIDNKNDTEVGYSLWMMANNGINVATLNGTNQGFYINTFPILGTADLSICCSFRSAPGTTGMLLSRHPDDNNYWASFVSLGQVGIVVSKGTDYIGWRSTDNTLQDNTTKHVVMTIKRNGTATISINGVSSTMYVYSSLGNINGISYDVTTPVTIGYRTYPGYNTYMPGKIWNVGCSFGTDLNIYKEWLGTSKTYDEFPQSLKDSLLAYYELSNYTNHNGYELIDRTGKQGNMTPLNSPIYTSEIPINNYLGASSTVTTYGGVINNGPLINGKTTWLFDNIDDGIKIQGVDTLLPLNTSQWHIWLVQKDNLAESFGPALTFNNYNTNALYGAIDTRDNDNTPNSISITVPESISNTTYAVGGTDDIGNAWHVVHVYKDGGNIINISIDNGPYSSITHSTMTSTLDTIGIGALFRVLNPSGSLFALTDIADVRICGNISTNQANAVYKDLRSRYFVEEPIPYNARILWNVGSTADISKSASTVLNEGVAPTIGVYQNGYTGMYYNGTNNTSRWAISGLATFDHQNFVVFIVANSSLINSSGISWSIGNSTHTINFYVNNSLYANKSMLQAETPSNIYGVGSNIITAGSVHVYRLRVTPTALYMSIDGCAEVSLSVNITGQSAMTRIGIGAYAVPSPNYYDEITVYEHSVIRTTDVTTTQLDLESLRLKNKYNI